MCFTPGACCRQSSYRRVRVLFGNRRRFDFFNARCSAAFRLYIHNRHCRQYSNILAGVRLLHIGLCRLPAGAFMAAAWRASRRTGEFPFGAYHIRCRACSQASVFRCIYKRNGVRTVADISLHNFWRLLCVPTQERISPNLACLPFALLALRTDCYYGNTSFNAAVPRDRVGCGAGAEHHRSPRARDRAYRLRRQGRDKRRRACGSKASRRGTSKR